MDGVLLLFLSNELGITKFALGATFPTPLLYELDMGRGPWLFMFQRFVFQIDTTITYDLNPLDDPGYAKENISDAAQV